MSVELLVSGFMLRKRLKLEKPTQLNKQRRKSKNLLIREATRWNKVQPMTKEKGKKIKKIQNMKATKTNVSVNSSS